MALTVSDVISTGNVDNHVPEPVAGKELSNPEQVKKKLARIVSGREFEKQTSFLEHFSIFIKFGMSVWLLPDKSRESWYT